MLPEFDRAFVLREMNLFPEWYIGRHLGVTLDAKQQATLDKVFEALARTRNVPELRVVNPLDANVLLYDGEELLGAKQNRILNVTVLVPAASEKTVPVSCVEEGRWHARSAAFADVDRDVETFPDHR